MAAATAAGRIRAEDSVLVASIAETWAG